MKTKTAEANFWEWFCSHADSYYSNLEKDQHNLLSELSKHLHIGEYDFAYMISPIDKKTKKRKFVISANDFQGLIPYVKKIVDVAPLSKLEDKWEIVALYQRETLPKTLEFTNGSLSTDDMYFQEYQNENGLCINLYIKPGIKSPSLKGAISIMLTAAIGEYDLLTYVKKIDVFRFDQKTMKDVKPLKELPMIIDEIKDKE
jgi:hypothetical protein